MHGVGIKFRFRLHFVRRHVGKFKGIVPAADADVCVHFRHSRAVVFRAEFGKFFRLPHQKFARNAVVEKFHKRQPAYFVNFFYNGVHQHIIDALGFDQDLFALFEGYRIIDEHARQLFHSGIYHDFLLFLSFFLFLIHYI